jgi:hypothetical protein
MRKWLREEVKILIPSDHHQADRSENVKSNS